MELVIRNFWKVANYLVKLLIVFKHEYMLSNLKDSIDFPHLCVRYKRIISRLRLKDLATFRYYL